MRTVTKWIGRVFSYMCTSSIAHGVLLWLENAHQIVPAKWVAGMIWDATNPETIGYAAWIIAGVSGLLGLGIWLAIERKSSRGDSTTLNTAVSDPELGRLRRDVLWLTDKLAGYGHFPSIKSEAIERYQRLKDSDHPLWAKNPAKQERREFVHFCEIAIADGKHYDSAEEHREVQSGLTRHADILDEILVNAGASTVVAADAERGQSAPGPTRKVSANKQPTQFTNGPPATFYRLRVENITNKTITGATGYLVAVEKNRVPQKFNEAVRLTFAPGEDEDALSKELPPSIPQYLDVCFLDATGRFGFGTKGRVQLNSITGIFDTPAEYRLTIKIAGDGVSTAEVTPVLHFTGDRVTTEMECPEVRI